MNASTNPNHVVMTNDRILQIRECFCGWRCPLRSSSPSPIASAGWARMAARTCRGVIGGTSSNTWPSFWFVPKGLIPGLAVLETIIETGLGFALLLGIYQRVVAWSSAALFNVLCSYHEP